MKVLRSYFFRSICAIIVGALLVQYREQTVTWITIAIGVLFFLSGVIALASYLNARKQQSDVQVYDAEGNLIAGGKPTFPLVGLGSLLLGMILALMPNVFVTWLMYILAAILILGAINQFMTLSAATKIGHVGWVFWLLPSVILLVGLIAIIRPSAIASAPLFIIGWTMIIYGIVELANALKVHNERKKYADAHPQQQLDTPQEKDADDEDGNS